MCTIWVNLEDIVSGEIIHIQKDKHHMNLLTNRSEEQRVVPKGRGEGSQDWKDIGEKIENFS
jgi:hypothetical protein